MKKVLKYSIKEVSEILGIPRNTIYQWIKDGMIKPRIYRKHRDPRGHELSTRNLLEIERLHLIKSAIRTKKVSDFFTTV